MKLFDVYSLYEIEPVKGEGNYIYTADGKKYLDFYGGHAVISVGHCHPHYVKVLGDQLGRLGFYSNSVVNTLQNKFADSIGRLSGYEDYSLFLCNSGAEANENAVKLASFHTGRKKILAFSEAFHGRTSGAVAMTDNPKIVSPFNRTENVVFSPFNDISAAEQHLRTGEFAAAIVEGIQGVGGIIEPSHEFLKALSKLTEETGTLLILDEIQSGCGRTGKYFAHQHAGIKPDIITMAKGIGNGFPMAGVLISDKIMPVKGMLGTTFGGNHLACAAGIAVAEIMEQEKLVENAAKTGEYLISRLRTLPGIKEIRGRGLMVGVETFAPAADLRKRLLFEQHVFTGGAGQHTIRLLPALTVTPKEVDVFIEAFQKVLAD